jgi:hypothetical protein
VLQFSNTESVYRWPLADLDLTDLGDLRTFSATLVEAYPTLQRATVGGRALTCSLTRGGPGGQIEYQDEAAFDWDAISDFWNSS